MVKSSDLHLGKDWLDHIRNCKICQIRITERMKGNSAYQAIKKSNAVQDFQKEIHDPYKILNG